LLIECSQTPGGKAVLRLLVVLVIWAAGYFGYLYVSGNFHVVLPGELYRSGQVTPERLAAYQGRYGIRSVINLRGENAGADWYGKEVEAARTLGMSHFDFRMSAKEHLSVDQADTLISIMRTAPKPILIHCRSGADRSGLTAALYLAAVAGAGERKAERQLSIRFGHVGIPLLSRAYAMDATWEDLEPWLGFNGS
jgi:protein tyrosine/serine phosphatase